MKQLPKKFFDRHDVVQIAMELLGKLVITNIDGKDTGGRIVETEAYVGLVDKASHSFNGRRTPKNEHMYCSPASSYIYICYGMHQMLNIITNKKDIPDAILIRAIEPLIGLDIMLARSGKAVIDHTLTKGPGNVGKALGLTKANSGKDLMNGEIKLYSDDESNIKKASIGISKRIGVESAGADGLLPYRFYIKGNKYVSGRPVK
jgi:DNA-3-methyladenine glycosylase